MNRQEFIEAVLSGFNDDQSLIRCENCKHATLKKMSDTWQWLMCDAWNSGSMVPKTGFCHKAEPREKGN